MSEFVEVKTADLVGPSLDWAVQMAVWSACGHLLADNEAGLVDGAIYVSREKKWSTDWAQGGPLLERFSSLIDSYLFGVAEHDDCKCDELVFSEHYRTFYSEISLPKICRHIVSAVLGDVVQVPAQLVEVKA